MTVLTQALSEKKLQSKSPNEIRQPLVDDDDQPSAPQVDIENGSTTSLTSRRSRVQRINNLTTLCVTLTALLVLTTGIVGGIYLYRQFAQYRLRHFRGWCSIPYVDPSHEELRQTETENRDSLLDFSTAIHNALDQFKSQRNDFFDEEFDIDLEFEEYEKIEVPDFSNGRKGRFIHDFFRNLTAIVDTQSGRCFIMALNRTKVLPPQSLYDMVTKMRNGDYDIDTETVRESYRVQLPAITEFKDMGYYIGRDCAKYQTYRLEKITHSAYKRSVTHDHNLFKYFAGVKINEIQIEGIPERSGNQ